MLYFPHPLTANKDGLLAIEGDLTPDRLLLAYHYGIFPWYDSPPILWWWTHPRCVMRPKDLKISKSLRQFLKHERFTVSFNRQFRSVISACATSPRPGQSGTWINDEMIDAYTVLHEMGYAHSVEVWEDSSLVGGLYGIAIGKIFFGESMFNRASNASKVGFVHLAKRLDYSKFTLIDCQQDTAHMRSLGSWMMTGGDFWEVIKQNLLNDKLLWKPENGNL